MLSNFSCPICRNQTWETVQRFSYDSGDHRKPAPWLINRLLTSFYKLYWFFSILLWPRIRKVGSSHISLNAYSCLRRRVLFEVWHVGKNEVEVRADLCLACGFIATNPRPDEKDLANKYAFLTKYTKNPNPTQGLPFIYRTTRAQRAREIFEVVKAKRPNNNLRVLDYGGGNGSMLEPFLRDGNTCFVADYYDGQIPGVLKIANDWDDFPKGERFDVILCNHVLEHVCNPLEVIQRFDSILAKGGVVFAEVPLEVWAGIPIEKEPVTHVNFFTHDTFQLMFELAGFSIHECKVQERTIMPSTIEVSWILAEKPAQNISTPNVNRVSTTRARLKPDRLKTLKRLFEIDLLPRLRNILTIVSPKKTV